MNVSVSKRAQVQARVPHNCALHGGDVGQQSTGIDEEIQKIFVIAKADASNHPRAVVIHAQEAGAAQAAVVRALRLFLVALPAPKGAAPKTKWRGQHEATAAKKIG